MLVETIDTKEPLNIPEKRAIIDRILEENKNLQGAPMVVLNQLQSQIGFITDAMQVYVAQKLHLPAARIHGVVTFYSFFTTKPRGKHVIKFCLGTACYVGGADQLIEKARQALGIDIGQTTPDDQITLEVCRCVGACSQAPVVVVDEDVHGRLKPNKFPQIIKKVQEMA
jgi:NADH-quinone oxidoreductase subunit E